MNKFSIGDRVQINGAPTDWNLGTVTGVASSFGEDYCNINWDSAGTGYVDAENLFLVYRSGVEVRLTPTKITSEPDREDPLPAPTFADKVDTILNSVGTLLKQKNDAYGDSALNPVRIFSKADPADGLRVRIDDKLSRIARGSDAGEDTVTDLLGYLVMLKISEGNK